MTFAPARPATPAQAADPADFPRRRWDVAEADADAAADLERLLKVDPVVARALVLRSFTPGYPDAARAFLEPSLKMLGDPLAIPGLAAAADRVARAVRGGERIVLYGDYDVDGITGTAVLWHALVAAGHPRDRVSVYIPHRVDEGYGLQAEALRDLEAAGADLVVSVDCGITAFGPALAAREVGLDLAITDHHDFRPGTDGTPELPDVDWLVHPRLPGSTANGGMVGAAVAFNLAWHVGRVLNGAERTTDAMRRFLVDATGLVALATVADVGKLVGENRVLVHHGLRGLAKSRLDGVQALIDVAGLRGGNVASFDVGFKIGPRLNAIGRIGHAADAVRLLTEASRDEAVVIATNLDRLNRERQAVERGVVREAEQRVEAAGWAESSRVLVVAGGGWHPGVVGLVASRLVEKFGRPAVALWVDPADGTAGGSGRSVGGFDIGNALHACADLLTKYGGHAMAAGVALPAAHVDAFRDRLDALAADALGPPDFRRPLRIEGTLSPGDVTTTLHRELEKLQPFGEGNPKPMFVLRSLRVLTARAVGSDGKTLQLRFDSGGKVPLRGVMFRAGDLAPRLPPGTVVDVAAEVTRNDFNGRTTAELCVCDLAFA